MVILVIKNKFLYYYFFNLNFSSYHEWEEQSTPALWEMSNVICLIRFHATINYLLIQISIFISFPIFTLGTNNEEEGNIIQLYKTL